MTKLENSATDKFRPGAKGREEAAHKTWENERGNEVVRRMRVRVAGDPRLRGREGDIKGVKREGGRKGGKAKGVIVNFTSRHAT